jgi:hypothetical protein
LRPYTKASPLQAEFDTHDEKECREKLPFLRKRSKIVEVVAAQDLIFALTRTGVCAVFSRGEKKLRCPHATAAATHMFLALS